jgi:hypothetical protein
MKIATSRLLLSAAAVALVAAACTSSSMSDDASSPDSATDAGLDAAPSDAAHATDATTSPIDAGVDALPDAAADASSDALADVTVDAPEDAMSGVDAAMDASPPQGVPVLAIGKITGATTAELTMIANGLTLANTTMATACFKTYVLSAKWTETNGLSQPQIWDKLCSGPINVDVDMYDGSWYEDHVSLTIGYENEPGTVHMNRYFVNTAYMVADNIIHEGEGHSQGFSHYGVKSTSVPYGLNNAFEACSPVPP